MSRPGALERTPGDLTGMRAGTTLAEALRTLRRLFGEAGLDTPALDARLLLTEALGISQAQLLTAPERPLGPGGAAALARAARRRLAREPVARILGHREFWGLPFALSPETLVPRPDSETVVATALALLGNAGPRPRILDLGTGSGCLLVALLSELPGAVGLGLDRSPGALRTARRNAVLNGVGARAHMAVSDWGAAAAGPFDLLVSNPPYVPTEAIAGLAPEVRDHDPRAALDGGPDGLDCHRRILEEAHGLIGPGGVGVLEIGSDQERAVRELARAAGFGVVTVEQDLAGYPRALAIRAVRRGGRP